MAEGITMPSSFGGLMRFNEEYKSKIMLKPGHIIAFIVAIIAFVVLLKAFLPISP